MEADKPKEGQKQLPSEILCKVYELTQSKEDIKSWQMVCRAWYLAVNDKARIQVNVPIGDGFYKKLYDDLVNYPTFGPKVCSITNVKNNIITTMTLLLPPIQKKKPAIQCTSS